MTEKVLGWIEEHARERGFTDEAHSLALVAEARRLREALERFGSHWTGDCHIKGAPCNCGLDEALGRACGPDLRAAIDSTLEQSQRMNVENARLRAAARKALDSGRVGDDAAAMLLAALKQP